MTPRAVHGQTKESRSEGLDPVGDVFHDPFVGNRSAFRINPVIPVIAGCHLSHESAVGNQVARHLLENKAVEWHVVVQGPDYPVPPNPHIADPVVLVPVGIGITGRIQPIGRHLFPVLGRGKQTIHHLFISIGRLIRHKGIDLLG